MLGILIIAVALLIGVILLVASFRPSEFNVTRSILVSAPPAKVFEQVNDLHKWEAWSPWAKLDPNATNDFSGPEAGTGASMAWSGNNKVGQGRMTIVESRPHELIKFKLEFLKPFAATNTAEFVFVPEGANTRVTWSMFGTNGLVAKVVGLFMSCEGMVGKQFEQGLTQMKQVAEAK